MAAETFEIDDPSNDETLYLNILVLKTSETQVQGADKEEANPLGFRALQNVAAAVAAKMVTEDRVAAQLAKRIPKALPEKMRELGIEADAEQVFLKGSLVVVKLAVKHVDDKKLLQPKVGLLSSCMCCSDEMMRGAVAARLKEALPKRLPEKLEENGMNVEVVARGEKEQQEYMTVLKKQLGSSMGPSCVLQ
eukprot:CAMPEP_0204519374 /NCGR_PEP_ID=MMETSP0661-20131031/4698_1 /ASSEMBLY_ACC=CAM_ASM_000606 /TAXON_ID=109239 /ORGANISM="Alexandrium margalefi, Strain AMGDE01CS-322" /LENGTH=191 /DNA_ID=CAMNT_0051524873 /DNA_START=54 /DNA_END=629 /DNA_ORIENTATION=+